MESALYGVYTLVALYQKSHSFTSLTCSISDMPQLVCKHRTCVLSMKYSRFISLLPTTEITAMESSSLANGKHINPYNCWFLQYVWFHVLRPWQMRTHCCRHIVADTNVSLFACMRNICCRHKFCVWDTDNVSHFVQKHFVSATNVSQFVQPKKHHEHQCVRNNVSSFTRAFMTKTINLL